MKRHARLSLIAVTALSFFAMTTDQASAGPCELGEGENMFHPPAGVFQIAHGYAVDAEDLNRDGDQDFVVARQYQLQVALGNGSGGFTVLDFPVPSALFHRDVAIGDFNDDGHWDIVSIYQDDYDDGYVSVRWGDAVDPWAVGDEFPVGSGSGWAVAAGDVDSDGLADIVAWTGGNMEVYLSEGNTFALFGAPLPALNGGWVRMALADIDNDNTLDLLWTGHNNIYVRRNPGGDGVFGNTIDAEMGSGGGATDFVTGDYDNDGNPDLIASRIDDKLVRMLGDGDGTFDPALSANVENRPYAIVAADFDSNGELDFATAYDSSAGVKVYMGTGAGNAVGPYLDHAPFNFPLEAPDMAAADFNEDGAPDLVVTSRDGLAYVLLTRVECDFENTFTRGDSDGDGDVSLTDVIADLGCQFLGRDCTSCPDAADTNDDGRLGLEDGVFLMNHLFRGGPSVSGGIRSCSGDSTPDRLPPCSYDSCSGPSPEPGKLKTPQSDEPPDDVEEIFKRGTKTPGGLTVDPQPEPDPGPGLRRPGRLIGR